MHIDTPGPIADGAYEPHVVHAERARIAAYGNGKTLVFDVDGTIADSLPLTLDIIRELVHRPLTSDHGVSSLRGMSIIQSLRALEVPIWKIPLLVRDVQRKMSDRLEELPLVPGMENAIRILADSHRLFIVSSNTSSNIRRLLERHNLLSCFIAVYGDARPLRKETLLRKLLLIQAIKADTAWYIGDETWDVRAAHRLGMHSLAVSWGYSNIHRLKSQDPDLLVFSPDELLNCFTLKHQ